MMTEDWAGPIMTLGLIAPPPLPLVVVVVANWRVDLRHRNALVSPRSERSYNPAG